MTPTSVCSGRRPLSQSAFMNAVATQQPERSSPAPMDAVLPSMRKSAAIQKGTKTMPTSPTMSHSSAASPVPTLPSQDHLAMSAANR